MRLKEMEAVSGEEAELMFYAVTDQSGSASNKKINITGLAELIHKEKNRVVRQCQHCNQWGALYLPCRQCGAPRE